MSLLSGKKLLSVTGANQYAIPSFDVAGGNIDMLHAVCSVLAKRNATAFLASTPSSINAYFGISHFVKSISEIAEEYEVRVAGHLDHAVEPSDIEAALEEGCLSVMFEGSELPFQENVTLTKQIVQKAHEVGASVEASLGIIRGIEDELMSSESVFPTVDQSTKFIQETKIDFFAPSIGTRHGFYKSDPDIQIDLVNKLSIACDRPLVLHGGTGLANSILKSLIKKGFKKINYATGIRAVFFKGIEECISISDKNVKPQVYLRSGRKAVSRYVSNILDVVMEQ